MSISHHLISPGDLSRNPSGAAHDHCTPADLGTTRLRTDAGDQYVEAGEVPGETRMWLTDFFFLMLRTM